MKYGPIHCQLLRGYSVRLSYYLAICFLFYIGLGVTGIQAQYLEQIEAHVSEFNLDNGLTFIIYERHETPTVICLTFANVGSVDEECGRTGLAHFLEHMAFKGTRSVGTTDYEKEAVLLERLEKLFQEIKNEESRSRSDSQHLEDLKSSFKEIQQAAQAFCIEGEMKDAYTHAGGRGLNTSTHFDYTVYHVNLPSNKIELWMSLESDRLLNPVFRSFFTEKKVVMEERLLRVDNNPIERFLEEFRGICYRAHPYGIHVIGHMSDIERLDIPSMREFYKRFYQPSNLTVAIVGDVVVADIRKMAQAYFGRIENDTYPRRTPTVEPAQRGERRVTVEDSRQSAVIVGYHIEDMTSPDKPVFDVIESLMWGVRTSRLRKTMVEERQIALNASGEVLTGKYPGLIIFYAFPSNVSDNEECLAAIDTHLDRLKEELVTEEEIAKAKTRVKARSIRSLTSNKEIAMKLAYYQVLSGDWRNLFHQIKAIEKVTPEDIRRVARKTFINNNRSVGIMNQSGPSAGVGAN